MSQNSIVRTRIDEHIKEEASIVLASIGLTISDALRMLLIRIAHEKALPFKPLVPDEKTISATRKTKQNNTKNKS
ncbi:Type II toxin-antitoxin system RelB/DinJ family antitoxin (plasmid) [Candidatus Trichorickettsia mobilis]|uniref:type II toxin-antitoxin system RelB/DinJ family antitoxin n=1 Tax=Candidatus Trichorickettsia mobilis TaxID=1346319 RepID=UPI002B25C9D1|nr:type II toxin-antitoxin system RelB/DinJ family antitoxin [Candidatus Trichorickettsia mobilis]WPY01745.1 Type II toxin-antitoxin system RelB/DinJ family antitoxin [Candidatus Trichorickettsia mobilis]